MKALTLAFIFVLPVFIYLGFSLSSTEGWILLSALFTLLLSFPFFRLPPFMSKLTFIAMGMVSYLLLFCGLRDVLKLFHFEFPNRYVYLSALLTMSIGFLIARSGPRVRRITLPIDGLPEELEKLNIVQISDLHIGANIRRPYVERVVNKVNELAPDIIAMTGDIGDGRVSRYKDDTLPLQNLRSRLGVFFVPGNHEYYWDGNSWLSAMNALGAVILVNRGKLLQHQGKSILISGIPDPASGIAPELAPDMKGEPRAELRVLLSHRPGIAAEAEKAGYHLQLSGHTHGGQFFPWTIVVRFFHRHHQGHYRIGKLWLNVNTGTGTWGPLLRLGTFSEITQIRLVAGQARQLQSNVL